MNGAIRKVGSEDGVIGTFQSLQREVAKGYLNGVQPKLIFEVLGSDVYLSWAMVPFLGRAYSSGENPLMNS